jgi:hypothetical protein
MSNGSKKRIADINIGDEVICFNVCPFHDTNGYGKVFKYGIGFIDSYIFIYILWKIYYIKNHQPTRRHPNPKLVV